MKQLEDAEQTQLYIDGWESVEEEFFKLETLQVYEPTPGLREFQQGKLEEARRLMKQFLLSDPASPYKKIKERGVKFIRVHIVDIPLGDYLWFEIESYRISAQLGEQIFFVQRENLNDVELPIEPRDFLMFDERVIMVHQYNDHGEWECSYLIEDMREVEKYVKLKKILLARAEPMEVFLQKVSP